MNDQEIVEIGLSDFEIYAEAYLRIAPKEGGRPIPFAFNRAQQYIHDRVEDQLARTGRVRAVILKGRQQGASTYSEGRFFWKTTLQAGMRAFILTHDKGTTDRLFSMVDRFYRYVPDGLRPHIGASNAKELYFDHIESGYEIGTAGNKTVGHGFTLQYFHASECARWPNAEEHLSGVFQAIADTDGTEIILESTANGVGGVFYDYCMEAQEGKGEYELIFVPWFWQDEYRRRSVRIDGIDVVADDIPLTDEELFLKSEYELDNQQIAWRRNKIYQLKSVELFYEQYPCTVTEAFVASGRGVFSSEWLEKANDECYTAPTVGEIQTSSKSFVERDDGELKIWQKPIPGEKYFIGGDPAEGLAKGDWTVAEVVDSQGIQVAEFRAHIEPDKFADILTGLGRMYNRAEVICERNNHGQLVLYRLAKEIGYPNIFTQVDFENQGEGKEQKKYGFLTTTKSKPLIIDHFAALMRDKESGIVSSGLVEECRTYVVDARGRTNAQQGKHDDMIMAYALAQYLRYIRRRRHSGNYSSSYQPVDSVAGY